MEKPLFTHNPPDNYHLTTSYTGHSDKQTFISDEFESVQTQTPRDAGGMDSYRALASAGRALARSTAAASVVGA